MRRKAALTHFDDTGNARMVDVGDKEVTERIAVARASVTMQAATLKLIREKKAKKGDVLAVAQLAGIRELHIGHAIISRAIFIGLREAVGEMKRLLREAQARSLTRP